MYDLINLIVNDRQKGLCIMIHHVLVSIKRILSATHLSFLWRFSRVVFSVRIARVLQLLCNLLCNNVAKCTCQIWAMFIRLNQTFQYLISTGN